VKKAVSTREHEILSSDFKSDQIQREVHSESVFGNEEITSSFVREIQNELSFTAAGERISGSEEIAADNDTGYNVIGSLFTTYILIERGDELVVIDFHAAHERMNYDMLISNPGKTDTQILLFPEVIELGQAHYQRALELIEDLNIRGFDIEPFSEDSIVVRSVPSLIQGLSVSGFVKDLIDAYENDEDKIVRRTHIIASRIACHASRRAGDSLSKTEMSYLADRVFSGEYELVCPHGRPYIFTMKRNEFEKLFRR
jgi:DNA mismatch repair protein MutL